MNDSLAFIAPLIAHEFTGSTLAEELVRRQIALIQESADCLLAWNEDGCVFFWNRGACLIYGFSAAEALGKPVGELLQTEVAGGWEALVGRVENGATWEGLLARRTRDGRPLRIHSRLRRVEEAGRTFFVESGEEVGEPLRPQGDEAGTQEEWVWAARQRAAELEDTYVALRESEARLRAVTETARIGLVIVDERHCYRYATRAYTEILNIPHDHKNLVGMRVSEVLPSVYETQIRPRLERAFSGERIRYELHLPPRVAGQEERLFSVTYDPDSDRWGKFVVVVIFDITEHQRTLSALSESEDLFSSAFRSSPVGIAINRRRDLINLEVNDAFLRIFECERNQIVGHTLLEAGVLRLETLQPIRQCLDERGGSFEGEIQAFTPAGKPLYIALSVKVIQLRGETCAITISSDITARKLADLEREKLLQLIEHSRDFIATAALDGSVTFLNRGGREMIGFGEDTPIEELRYEEFVPEEWLSFISDTIFPTALREGIWEGEMQLRNMKSGATIDIFRSVFLVRDKQGEPMCFATVTRDITGQKRTERALREALVDSERNRAQFEAVFEAVNDGIVVTDMSGRFVLFNRAQVRMNAFESGDAMLKHFLEYPAIYELTELDGRALPLEEWPLSRVLRGESVLQWDLRVRRTDLGRDWIVRFSGEPVRAQNGRQILAVIVSSDVTEQKNAQEQILQLNATLEQRVIERTAQLEAANKELEAFSYSVSHDLRSPLRAIDGFSLALEEDYAPQLPAEAQRYLHTIRTGAQRMGTLIDDLLTFSRLSRSSLRRARVRTAEMVHLIVEEHQSPEHQVRVEVAPLPECWADAALLRQVWINLIANAFKYTRKKAGPLIEIGTLVQKGETAFFIRDNGTGFDMRYAEKLFGVFQRLHRAEDYEGTGVGLAIVQRIVHRHGGRVWAEAAVDAGATFFFTLAAENSDSDSPAPPQRVSP